MATRDNLIAAYNANPTLQKQYTLDEYLALFDFGTQTPTPDPDPDPTPTPVTPGIPNIINQNIRQGDDGPKGDFGIFGNLDKSTAKDFNVEVYDEEVGDFVPTTITGYKNVSSGLYQDKFGKNLQPAFSNTGQAFGLFGLARQALGLAPDTVGGYVPGSIRGKFDSVGDMFGSAKNIFQQKKIREQQSIQQELAKKAMQEQIAKAEAQAQAAQRQSDQARINRAYREDTGPGPGSYGPGGGSGVQSDGSYYDPFDPGGGEKDGGFIDGTNRRKYDDGGRVYLYNRLK